MEELEYLYSRTSWPETVYNVEVTPVLYIRITGKSQVSQLSWNKETN